ncbi:MAG: extradiol ring-cleavage dioxygenase [Gammaproteobacteria bacterium]|nr:extradiol ring-cleavage dioxygenase [Gammaproteobacteria bacterium]
MSLVYVGVLSHAPGITGRADLVKNVAVRNEFYEKLDQQRQEIETAKPDALVVVAAEHFANFFMSNMPAFCIGIGAQHTGPIEDPQWLKIPATTVPGHADLGRRLCTEIMQSVDLAYAEEWKLDHGIMVPLHFLTPRYDLPVIPVNINCQGPPLTPLHRAWAFGQALKRACAAVPERVAVVGTGGISHWPATPDSGKINAQWDLEFLARLGRADKKALLSYTDEATYREGGQGAFEIRTYIAAAAAAGGPLRLQFYTEKLPIFAVGCTVGRFDIR